MICLRQIKSIYGYDAGQRLTREQLYDLKLMSTLYLLSARYQTENGGEVPSDNRVVSLYLMV